MNGSFKLFFGADECHHGYWLCTLNEFDINGTDTRRIIVEALNEYIAKHKND